MKPRREAGKLCKQIRGAYKLCQHTTLLVFKHICDASRSFRYLERKDNSKVKRLKQLVVEIWRDAGSVKHPSIVPFCFDCSRHLCVGFLFLLVRSCLLLPPAAFHTTESHTHTHNLCTPIALGNIDVHSGWQAWHLALGWLWWRAL